MSDKKYDAIVVGSGAAGGFAAKELTERGLEVLVLEAGPWVKEEDFAPLPPGAPRVKRIDSWARVRAALEGQYNQARAVFFSDRFKHLFVNDRRNPYTTPPGEYYLWVRGRQIGGRLHTYGRVVQRMSDYDFKVGNRDGLSDNWPISYQDIAPYYDRVEEFLGVYGTVENIPNLPDGKYIAAPKLTRLEQAFKAKIESTWPERKVIPWRQVSPNLKRVPWGILDAQKTGRLEVRADAVASKIDIDPDTGRAIGVTYVDREAERVHSVSANIVVLCASTIESVRLMLNSACSKHPEGLGNSAGLLGRYFMDQAPSLVFGNVPDSPGFESDDSVPQDPFYGPSGGVLIPRFENLDRKTNPNFARGFAFQGQVGRGAVPDGQPAVFGFMGFGETLPYRDNRITLDPRKKDAWGIPSAHIKCALTRNEHELMREQVRSMKEMVTRCGFKINFAGNTLGLDNPKEVMRDASLFNRMMFRLSFRRSMAMGAAIHECGGARMGDDPGKSVLNPYNQCWDVKNLFVTDGSCFVSNGTVGPTLTIMALTIRACEYIAREYQRENL
ncbi:MAG TPA: GMC family oxidoreductase [Patescibacteria group bacterium]|nr:GMC family oxidoreductase [Patescibacteria group bacterium]